MESLERLYRHPESGAEVISNNDIHSEAYEKAGFVEVAEETNKKKK